MKKFVHAALIAVFIGGIIVSIPKSTYAAGLFSTTPGLGVSAVTMVESPSLLIERELSLGMRGEDVKVLQKALAQWPKVYPEALVTGYFGQLTKKAIKNFQMQNSLVATEKLDAVTLKRLNEVISAENAPTISSAKAENIGSGTVRVSWTTDIPATTKVEYTATSLSSKSKTWNVADTSLTKEHVVDISRLASYTTYRFNLISVGASGSAVSSTELSFSTAQ